MVVGIPTSAAETVSKQNTPSTMKRFFPVFFAVALFSCHENTEGVPRDNFIAADRNGTSWQGTCEMQLDSSDTLRIWGRASEETLYMFIKFEGVGAYELLGHNAGFYQTLGETC